MSKEKERSKELRSEEIEISERHFMNLEFWVNRVSYKTEKPFEILNSLETEVSFHQREFLIQCKTGAHS